MKSGKLVSLIVLLLVLTGCNSKRPIDYVDPFIGTGFHGHTYPGATVPFGAVQLSPDTRKGNWDACSGYHYSDSSLFGFSHTHLSGTGCIDLGDILVHPTNGIINYRPTGYIFEPLQFSHSDEKASPGYYSVMLSNGILAELTATAHTGIHRYTFPREGEPKIIFDLSHLLDNEMIEEAELKFSNGELSGMRRTKGWVSNQYIFFVARFSNWMNADLISNGESSIPSMPVRGENIQAVLSFPGSQGKPVVVTVGVSNVSIENARMNLEKEAGDFNFDRIRGETENQWNNALSTVLVKGDISDMTNFYTSVYHTMLTPNIISDVNGDYRGADMKILNSGNRKVFSTFSLWDTFRAWNPLVTLTDTSLVNNMINSFLDFFDQTGQLPVWPLSSGETGTMIGYHSVSVIYDAYSKSIRGFDAERAFKAMKISADLNSKGTSAYLEAGFIPSDSRKESVSCLLENAYDDWCIAQMAKSLGYMEDYESFSNRAQFYKNVFDGDTRFFRSRLRDGIWEKPFNPSEAGRAFTEATAWQYRFFVPHDINGLINMFGGREAFTGALDSLFNTSSLPEGGPSDISGLIGQYAHGNEPSHHMAYLYSYAGQPWKTQQMVNRLRKEMYSPSPEGIIGNEDCGQMSAWYVLSSLGIYPVCPGSTQFILTAPLFDNAVLRLAGGKTLEITATDPSKNTYIKDVVLNGFSIKENFLTWSQIADGGKLDFVLTDTPDTNRGTSTETFPYSMSISYEVSVPFVVNDISFFEKEVFVECGTATIGAEIRYTTDGSVPDEQSPVYNTPFKVDNTVVIKLKAFKEGLDPSIVSSYTASKAVLRPSSPAIPTINGINFRYFEGNFSKTSDITVRGKLIRYGVCEDLTLAGAGIADHFAFIFSGFLYAPVDGVYTFSTSSDDGSVFNIGGKRVTDNDGSHSNIRAVGRIALGKGFHPYELLYFEDYEGEALSLSWIIPGKVKEEKIESKYLYIK